MRSVGVILWILISVSTARPQEIVEWKPTVLTRATYGNGSGEYGSFSLGESEDGPIRVVSCFTVTRDHILIFDWARREIKVYTNSGDFVREIDAIASKGPINKRVPARDIAEIDGDIFLLTDFAGQPVDSSVEWSRFQIFEFDMDTGEMMHRYFVHNLEGTEMGTRRVGGNIVPVRGSVKFQPIRNGLNLLDVTSRESRGFIHGGKLLPDEQNTVVTKDDWYLWQYLRTNRETGEVEVVGVGGDVLKVVGKGSVIASSDDQQHYAVLMGPDVLILDGQGIEKGRIPFEKRTSWPFERVPMHNRYKIVIENDTPRIYEIVIVDDGVELIRWTE